MSWICRRGCKVGRRLWWMSLLPWSWKGPSWYVDCMGATRPKLKMGMGEKAVGRGHDSMWKPVMVCQGCPRAWHACSWVFLPSSGRALVVYSVGPQETPWEVAQLPSRTSLKLGGDEVMLYVEPCPSKKILKVLPHSVCDCGLSRIGSLQMIKLRWGHCDGRRSSMTL